MRELRIIGLKFAQQKFISISQFQKGQSAEITTNMMLKISVDSNRGKLDIPLFKC